MTAECRGYFTHRQAGIGDGLRYAFRLPDGHEYPDPASRWQPDGVHRPSAVFWPGAMGWSDVRLARRVPRRPGDLRAARRYFTPEGTFEATFRD